MTSNPPQDKKERHILSDVPFVLAEQEGFELEL